MGWIPTHYNIGFDNGKFDDGIPICHFDATGWWQASALDGVIFSDVDTLNIAKALADGVIFADAKTLNIAKPLADGVIFSDSKVHDVSKSLVDGVIFSDSKVHDVSKLLVDGIRFSESKVEGDISHTSGDWIGHKIYNLLNAFGWDAIQQIQEVWTKISEPISSWTTKTIGASADWVKKNFSTSNWTKK